MEIFESECYAFVYWYFRDCSDKCIFEGLQSGDSSKEQIDVETVTVGFTTLAHVSVLASVGYMFIYCISALTGKPKLNRYHISALLAVH